MYEYSHQLGQMKITNHFTSIQVRFYCQMSYKNLSIFRVCSTLRFKIRESRPVLYSNSLPLTSGSKTITFLSLSLHRIWHPWPSTTFTCQTCRTPWHTMCDVRLSAGFACRGDIPPGALLNLSIPRLPQQRTLHRSSSYMASLSSSHLFCGSSPLQVSRPPSQPILPLAVFFFFFSFFFFFKD